jgi:chromosome segregation protein
MEDGHAAQKELDEQAAAVTMEEAACEQKAEFVNENMQRLFAELHKLSEESAALDDEAGNSGERIEEKQRQIEAFREEIRRQREVFEQSDTDLEAARKEREAQSALHREYVQKREDLAGEINETEKELMRLTVQQEKNSEKLTDHRNYMWEEYELTYHAALELRREEYQDAKALKKEIAGIRSVIRSLGPVNVNAIEEYKEVSERYEFLKTQHEDIEKAREALIGIIKELDEGMRRQFAEKFADIQEQFNKVFRELFGGGKGTLELTEDEDILESGIRIIAQPPGKKLQNMMQLSGGEKALTAISLLFAIQNLKPSPFCLLDEIEAALDDSNVGRYAQYLHNLTENTQFIVITHRRGTMNAADRLYGITMQEKGVSALVSVDLIESGLEE